MSELEAADAALFVRGGEGDPRLGERAIQGPVDSSSLAGSPAEKSVTVALIGIADGRGVTNGGGRAGAMHGPHEIRRWLYKMTTGGGGELRALRLFDLGDATIGIAPERGIEEVHALAEESIRTALVAGARVVVLGGGHDGAFASHSALLRSLGPEAKVSALNIDPRCDVRPPGEAGVITSGSQFRRLRERWEERYSLVEFGIQMQHNAEEHVAWAHAQGWPVLELRRLREDGVEKRFLRQLTRARASSEAMAVSIDLASVEAASAPGVSLPCPDGFSPAELLAFTRAAGRESCVKLLDTMECAPPLDENDRTARLAAAAIWSFLAGACEGA